MITTIRILANKYLGKSVMNRLRGINTLIDDTLMSSARRQFYGQFVQAGSLCFDVGANIGNRIKPLQALGARVVAVEPQVECCEVLRKHFGDSITIVNKGLGGQEEKREFYVSDASTLSTFSSDWIKTTAQTQRFEGYTWSDVRQIEITTLDALITQYGLPDFVKIDVEGFELEVVSGLSQPVRMLSFEYAVPEYNHRVVDVLLRLQQIYRNKLVCNYAAGETMKWRLADWLSADAMLDYIQTKDFLETSSGDIYIRQL